MAEGGFESLDDPVDVLTVFEEGTLKPLRFRWQGRVIRVRKVSGTWTRREGQSLLRYYAVEGAPAGTFELCFDPRGPAWSLTRAWMPEARRGSGPEQRSGPRQVPGPGNDVRGGLNGTPAGPRNGTSNRPPHGPRNGGGAAGS